MENIIKVTQFYAQPLLHLRTSPSMNSHSPAEEGAAAFGPGSDQAQSNRTVGSAAVVIIPAPLSICVFFKELGGGTDVLQGSKGPSWLHAETNQRLE